MANFVKHTPCPNCGSRDNRAEYSDGSAWCFGCGRYEPPEGIRGFTKDSGILVTSKSTSSTSLPEDVRPQITAEAISWAGKYGITRNDLVGLRCLWSDSRRWLIFPFFDEYGSLIDWQARCFDPEQKRKYHSSRTIHSLIHIYEGKTDASWLTLTEGVLDAYKVSKAGFSAMPIFGSHISVDLASRLLMLGRQRIRIWLDPDKLVEAVKFSRMLQTMGFDTQVVISDADPKESVITDYLTEPT